MDLPYRVCGERLPGVDRAGPEENSVPSGIVKEGGVDRLLPGHSREGAFSLYDPGHVDGTGGGGSAVGGEQSDDGGDVILQGGTFERGRRGRGRGGVPVSAAVFSG